MSKENICKGHSVNVKYSLVLGCLKQQIYTLK